MKRVLMLTCMVLPLWLSSCAQDGKGHEIEQTINEGYGNYVLVPAGKFSMGDNYDETQGKDLSYSVFGHLLYR